MRLAEARKRAKLTQRTVAEKLKVTPAAISLWESGQTNPKTELLPEIAKLDGVKIDDLF